MVSPSCWGGNQRSGHNTTGELAHHGATPGTREAHERCHNTTGELAHHGATPGTRGAHERCHITTGELAHHGATPGTRGIDLPRMVYQANGKQLQFMCVYSESLCNIHFSAYWRKFSIPWPLPSCVGYKNMKTQFSVIEYQLNYQTIGIMWATILSLFHM